MVGRRLAAGFFPLLLSGALVSSASPGAWDKADASTRSRTARHLLVALGTVKDYRVAGARYDLVIVSPEQPVRAALDRARQAHPHATILGYLNTMDMNDLVPGAREALRGHEDWYLHDASGQRVRVRADKYKGERSRFGMNVGKVGYQDYLASRAIEILRAGYDGLQLDNVETDSSYHPSRVGGFISAMPVELNRGSWPEAERAMLARIRERVAAAGFADRLLVINEIRSGEPEVSRLYLKEVDGANCETWLFRGLSHDGRFGWKAKVDQAAEVSRSGVILNLINKTESVEREESLYLFASHLLAQEGAGLHFYHGSFYKPEGTRWHDFYDLDIGGPVEKTSLRGGIYTRSFTEGWVGVNPFDRAITVTPPSGLLELSGAPAGTLSLQPKSAAILVRSRASASATRSAE